METGRSEYSDDGGGRTSRLSISLSTTSLSSSRSSSSNLKSVLEQKFAERKANSRKQKIRKDKELNGQTAEVTSLWTIEQQWRAEREADRQIRHQEMQQWLPDPSKLQQIQQRAKQQSRQSMCQLKDWYAYPAEPKRRQTIEIGDDLTQRRVKTPLAAEPVYSAHALQAKLQAMKAKIQALEQFGYNQKSPTTRKPGRRSSTNQRSLAPLAMQSSASVPALAPVDPDDLEAEVFLTHYRRQRKQASAAAHIQRL